MKHRYFYIETDNFADRGFNRGLQVYKLTKGYPKFIGANYKINSASWKGYPAEARLVIQGACGHELPDCYQDFPAASVTLKDVNGN